MSNNEKKSKSVDVTYRKGSDSNIESQIYSNKIKSFYYEVIERIAEAECVEVLKAWLNYASVHDK